MNSLALLAYFGLEKWFITLSGDPEPAVNPDKFTLYDFKFCPFCQRVRYTLDYHRIP